MLGKGRGSNHELTKDGARVRHPAGSPEHESNKQELCQHNQSLPNRSLWRG